MKKRGPKHRKPKQRANKPMSIGEDALPHHRLLEALRVSGRKPKPGGSREQRKRAGERWEKYNEVRHLEQKHPDRPDDKMRAERDAA